jgi:hypothetical protein
VLCTLGNGGFTVGLYHLDCKAKLVEDPDNVILDRSVHSTLRRNVVDIVLARAVVYEVASVPVAVVGSREVYDVHMNLLKWLCVDGSGVLLEKCSWAITR